ncbi:MAG: ion channel [Candidatus Campbellbacteria bacterium]|nr:ion channel [Candidatus Campbellbacteria bacterium]
MSKTYKEKAQSILNNYRYQIFALAVDLFAIVYFIYESFTESNLYPIAVVLGIIFIVEYVIGLVADEDRVGYFFDPISILELILIVSFITPANNLGFIRALRFLRSLKTISTYRKIKSVSNRFYWYQKYKKFFLSLLQLVIFIILVTGVVYAIQADRNPNINNYTDALYFTVTTISTTGYGDITPVDEVGRLISVLIMLLGITLFLRFASSIIIRNKVHYRCKQCGLLLHDSDAVHCKHCGAIVNIKTEGRT